MWYNNKNFQKQMASEKINKKFMLLAIILLVVFVAFFSLVCYIFKTPETENEVPVIEEDELSIIEKLTVPVDPNVEIEPISEEVIKKLTVPVDPNIEVESVSEEVIKNLTAPK